MHSLLSTEQDIRVIGMVTDGKEVLKQVEEKQPDVVLIDMHIPNIDGIKLTVHMKEKFPTIKVIFLTTFTEEELIIKGIISGADGFLLKTVDTKGLIRGIRNTYDGEVVFSGEVAKILANRIAQFTCDRKKILREKLNNRNIHLTNRELDVASLVMEDMTNKKIAQQLYLSEGTVKNYISELYQKFRLRNRKELAKYLNSLCENNNDP